VLETQNGELELVTPRLDGSVVNATARTSILELVTNKGTMKVSERGITKWEIINALKKNKLREIFLSGKDCFIRPVVKLEIDEVPYEIKKGPVAENIGSALEDIFWGITEHRWCKTVKP
jgi:branched-chain amino acid aminotransferase